LNLLKLLKFLPCPVIAVAKANKQSYSEEEEAFIVGENPG
jgi:hypothetical protein